MPVVDPPVAATSENESVAQARASSWRVLKNRNYLIYFSGQLITMSGTYMQTIAQSWLVYRLTGSGYWLGMINVASLLPSFLISPFVGFLADRRDRRKILIGVQIVALIEASCLSVLVYTGAIQVWHILALAIVLGCATAFDITTRHAFAIDMVGKKELSSAIALNSVILNASRIVGPAFAGIVIELVGEKGCFMANAFSCIPVILGMMVMDVKSKRAELATPRNVFGHIADGWRYARGHAVIFKILLLSSFVCFAACSYTVLLPVFAKVVLQGSARQLAWLSGMMGVGAVLSGLTYQRPASTRTVRNEINRDIFLWGVGLLLLGVSKWAIVSLAGVFLIGFFMMRSFLAMNNTIQHLVEDSVRGRVMSLYSMSFLGTVPIGSFLAGAISDHVGAPMVAIVQGALMTVAAFAILILGQRSKLAHA